LFFFPMEGSFWRADTNFCISAALTLFMLGPCQPGLDLRVGPGFSLIHPVPAAS
jgi:hypothetical protein